MNLAKLCRLQFFFFQGVIEARMDSFTSAHVFGLSLVDQGHFAAEEIQENCEEMTLVKDELMESWKEKQVELSQSYELQVRLAYARTAYLSYTGKEGPCENISHFLVARGTGSV